MPEDKLPIVIIGCGSIIKDAHIPAYEKAGFNILGIYDRNLTKAKKLAFKYPIVKAYYNTLNDLILEAKVKNAVYDIAVPANAICDILIELPEGSVVLIQKPMGETLEQAEKIAQLCKRKKMVSAVNFQLRYAPEVLAVKDIIQRKLIGDIYDIEVNVCANTPWQIWDFLYPLPRVEILYHSIHYLDLIRNILGDPKSVYASSIKHPRMPELASTRSTIILYYDDFVQARIITNHGHDYGLQHQFSYIKFEGSTGAAKITLGVSLDYPKGKPSKCEYYIREEGDQWKEEHLKGSWFPDAFIGSMSELQKHVQDSNHHLSHSTCDALETMRLVENCYKSSQSGGWPNK